MTKDTKPTNADLKKILPDWDVMGTVEEGFDIEAHSPAGEDILMSLSGTLGEMILQAESVYDDYDPDDHAAVIYHAKHYGSEDDQRFYASAPGMLEDLVEDSHAIDNMYWGVLEALRGAEE